MCIDRLKSQITNQLIDERLRLQEAQRRKVVVPGQANRAMPSSDIEQRNGMPAGALRQSWRPMASACAR